MLDRIQVDTHTHTVLSGHAWSTLRENAAAAAKRGMAGMCLTEHGYALPGSPPFFATSAQKMLPTYMEGVRIYRGVEANLMDLTGRLDIDDKSLFSTEFCIASMHDLCVTPGSLEENTRAYIGALEHPCVDILGHIDDRRTPSEFSVVIGAAARLGKLIEINNNSLLVRRGAKERVEEVIRRCADAGARVAVSSDAHVDEMIGAVEPALELLAQARFPEELVVNRDLETFESYLAERTARLDAARERYAAAGVSVRRTAQ